MNSAEKKAVLHCLKSMIDEEVCEECPLYGTTGTDHCEKDCVRLAINALSGSENPNKWIPIGERLPEEHKEVLTCSLGGFIEIQSYEDGCGGYWENQKGDWSDICEVVAWMPLPKQYQPEIPTVAEGSDE